MATSSFPRLLPAAKARIRLLQGGRDIWHKSAPASITRPLDWGEDTAGWKAWREHLSARPRPLPPEYLLGDPVAFLWGWPERGPATVAGLARRIEKLLPSKKTRPELGEELRHWLSDISPLNVGIDRALDSICWCWHLPRLAKCLSATLWWSLLDRLIENVHNAGRLSRDENPAVHQILAGELPLTLVYLFPELKVCRQQAALARQVLAAGLESLVDDGGYLHGRYWAQLGPLLGSWTRTRTLGARLHRGSWPEGAQERYRELVTQALRATRGNATVVLGSPRKDAWPASFWRAAIAAAGGKMAVKLAAIVLTKRFVAPRLRVRRDPRRLPDPAAQSDPSCIALMRAQWRRSSDLLAIDYAGSVIGTELRVGRGTVWAGDWGLEVQVHGEHRVPTTPWESVCWVADEGVVYFELERSLTGGIRVQRQMLLARQDRFVMMADTVLGSSPGEIRCRSTLPLAEKVAAEPAADTRELTLHTRAGPVRVLPCALEEWRQAPAGGSLEMRDASLVFESTVQGSNLFAPLLIDIDPRRHSKPLTWRSLTVAEDRVIQPRDVAAGYRIQIGQRQWLIYRATADRAGRTVLGANTWSQFLLMRIKRSGRLDTLLEIE